MFAETSAAPTRLASKAEICLYRVPTRARSASSSTGVLIAVGNRS